MSLLSLVLSCGDYDINRPLIDGVVRPQGIDLTVLSYPTPPRQWRMDQYGEFDVCEYSLSAYLAAYDRQATGKPLQAGGLTAIPVFPHRRFRHSYVFVNPRSGLRTPLDLQGRRVGLRSWQNTAGVWIRGTLQDQYGLDLKGVEWYTSDDEPIAAPPPDGFHVSRLSPDANVVRELLDGNLDALIYPELPAPLKEGDDRIRPLFQDPKAEEIAYFQSTGCFPIMHTVVIKLAIVERHAWVARNLQLAFAESKDLAIRRMGDPRTVSVAWLTHALEEQARILGSDPWRYGFLPNHAELSAITRYAFQQGITSRLLEPSEIFWPTTIADLPQYH